MFIRVVGVICFIFSVGCVMLYGQQIDIREKGLKKKERNVTKEKVDVKTIPAVKIRVKGVVTDEENKEPLPGVYIKVYNSVSGCISDANGKFQLAVELQPPVRLQCSFTGYAHKEIEVFSDEEVEISLKPEGFSTDEIVVSASRIEEKILESPVTIEKVDLLAIRENPSITFYDGLANLKGVDMFTSSLTFKVMNLRGFNSTTNPRFVQRIDGIDMQVPGLNFPAGFLNGASDIDIESAEIIPGAASALYGPNAFNGVMNITSKNAFKYPGLSAQLKLGVNHADGIDRPISGVYDFALRYGHIINDKMAFKINVAYLESKDWICTSTYDDANYTGTNNPAPGPGNPGYNGLNLYGDEVAQYFDSNTTGLGLVSLLSPQQGKLLIARTGYKEESVVNYNLYSIKVDGGFNYRISQQAELSYVIRWAAGSTIYQSGNRNVLKDFSFQNHKIELSAPRYFLRAFISAEDAGNSYDSRFAAIGINRAAKSDESWFYQYLLAYSDNPLINSTLNQLLVANGRNPVRPNTDADARAFADSDNRALKPQVQAILPMLIPGGSPESYAGLAEVMTGGQARFVEGTPEFNKAFRDMKNTPIAKGGAKFITKTMFWQTEGQYDFSDKIKFVDLIAGGSFRQFRLNSEGTIFADTLSKKPTVYEYGAYVQAIKRLLSDRVRFSASCRYDLTQKFKPVISPRFAGVFTVGEKRNHNLRLSYQTGFRMPTLQAQYIDLNVGAFRFTGGFRNQDNVYVFITPENAPNAYTLSSVNNFFRSITPQNPYGDSLLLRKYEVKDIRPEQIRTYDIGYKALFAKQLMIDLNYYYSRYNNFIGTMNIIGPDLSRSGDNGNILTESDIRNGYFKRYRRYSNSDAEVFTHGFSAGITWSIKGNYTLSFNYTFNELLLERSNQVDDLVAGFNTPKNKFNVGFAARNLLPNKALGFNVLYRFVQSFYYDDGFGKGTIPEYGLWDAQINYKLPKVKSILKLGGMNIFNNRHNEIWGGPTVGALYYIQLNFDQLLY